jgi:hypothetical protein
MEFLKVIEAGDVQAVTECLARAPSLANFYDSKVISFNVPCVNNIQPES